MPQRIVGIDLGSWSIKAVLVETGFRNFRVLGVRELRVLKGDPQTRGERQASALKTLLEDGEFRADAYVAALPAELATSRFISLPFSDPKRVEQIIPGELADLLPFEIETAVIDHAIVRRLPEGGTLSLCAAAPKDKIASFLSIFQRLGIEPKFLPVDVFQLFNLYASCFAQDLSKAEAPLSAATDAGTYVLAAPGGPPDARLIVDIGHERTLVSACSDDGISYMRVIRSGGAAVTAAIAKAYGIGPEDAEGGKHADALVNSSRHPAPTDAAQRMSDVCAEGLRELIVELRRTLQAIRSEKRVRISRVDLLGGGSRIRNLANYVADELNVPTAQGLAAEQMVERQVDLPRRPAFACALAYALRTTAEMPVSKIDLRVGEFAFAGGLRHLKERIPTIAVAIGAVFVLLGANVWSQLHVISAREKALDAQFCAITKAVVGREICEPKQAKSVIMQPASELGGFKLPERSAYRVAAEISHMIPEKSDVLIQEIEITPDRVRISGETTSFDAVDQIVDEYAKDACYQDIKKGKLRKKTEGQGVEFQLSIHVVCS